VTKKALTNVASSVRQRLLNLAKAQGEDFQRVLVRYANERLLYRLSVSPHAGDFVLKGAMLLYAWTERPTRATQDLDLLGRGEVTAAKLRTVFKELCEVDAAPDGLVLLSSTVRVGLIREEQEYGGFRVRLEAKLTEARISLQVDVGIGDAVTPRPTLLDYPGLLDLPAARIRAYPREAVVAEKFHAMVEYGLQNSRMKDFFDLWLLSREFEFDGERLAQAVTATFKRRRSQLPTGTPTAFTQVFAKDATKRSQWNAFLKRSRVARDVPPFEDLLAEIAPFILPAAEAAAGGTPFRSTWRPGGPWRR
jgi:hypothetical protein